MKPPRSALYRAALLLLAGAAAADSTIDFLPPTPNMLPLAYGQTLVTTGEAFDASGEFPLTTQRTRLTPR
jgi:hypothetical protein